MLDQQLSRIAQGLAEQKGRRLVQLWFAAQLLWVEENHTIAAQLVWVEEILVWIAEQLLKISEQNVLECFFVSSIEQEQLEQEQEQAVAGDDLLEC